MCDDVRDDPIPSLSLLITTVRAGAQTTAGYQRRSPPRPRLGDAGAGANRREASAAPVQKATVSLFFSEPLSARLATWGDVRLSSIPVDVQSTLVTLPADAGKIATTLPLNQLVRSGEFLVGVSYQVAGGKSPGGHRSLIASCSPSMPLAPTGDRFFRQYYGGIHAQSTQRTHIVDVTLGQNEAITGGRLRGTVMRVDSFYALPVTGGNFPYLFEPSW